MGQWDVPIVRDPELIAEADYVFIESTYGNRLHKDVKNRDEIFLNYIKETYARGGKVFIPSFAIERTQELIYSVYHMVKAGEFPYKHIYLDSPLAIEATRVFTRHSDLFDQDMADLWRQNRAQSILPGLHISRTSNQSMALNRIHSGAIIIAGSGMCSGGRIKQHLKHNIWRRECHVIISGFQARGTLGRQIIQRPMKVRIHGQMLPVRARVEKINGFSAHADEEALNRWLDALEHPPRRLFVCHGDEDVLESFAQKTEAKRKWKVTVPHYQDSLTLDE